MAPSATSYAEWCRKTQTLGGLSQSPYLWPEKRSVATALAIVQTIKTNLNGNKDKSEQHE